MVGGRVRGRTQAVVDDWALRVLGDTYVDVAFVGTNGITLERGLTTPTRRRRPSSRPCWPPPGGWSCWPTTPRWERTHFARFGGLRGGYPDHRLRTGRRRRRPAGGGRTHGGARMIVTLTPNPSVDRTIEVDALHRGAVLRARATRVDPGGKGVNVSRALAANGRETTAVLPAGGWEGEQLAALLAPLDVPVVVVPVAGSVRANVSVVEPDGTVTKLNEPGPRLSEEEIEAVTAATVKAAADAEWLACTGSLPPGGADRLLRPGGRAAGHRLGQGGGRLQRRPAGGRPRCRPRPDQAEPGGAGRGHRPPCHPRRRGRGGRGAARPGVGAVLASLGADGAVLVDATGATFGSATVDKPRSAVGAGDSMLAGFLAGGGSGPRPWPRRWPGARARPACPAAACRPPTTSTATPSPWPTASTPTAPSRNGADAHGGPHHPRPGRPQPDPDRAR